ncbi:MAG: PEP-CTERM sorting domain-containing protein [Gemmatirosa sp.]
MIPAVRPNPPRRVAALLAAVLAGLGAALAAPSAPLAAQVVRSAVGIGAAAVTPARDAFRSDLGGGTVAGANGSFGGVRREINWDGAPAASSAPNAFPGNFFNVNSPRGLVTTTPGTGFQVSGATGDAGAGQPAAADFGNIDPSYTAVFDPFSAQRLFTPIGSNVTDVTFFVPGTTTAAVTRGFGVVFSDVDLANTTSLALFNAAGTSLGTFFAPALVGTTATFSFLGVSFADAIVARVRIVTGNAVLGPGVFDQNGNPNDLVAMDDFLYGEPAAVVPEPATLLLTGSGLALLALGARRRARRR